MFLCWEFWVPEQSFSVLCMSLDSSPFRLRSIVLIVPKSRLASCQRRECQNNILAGILGVLWKELEELKSQAGQFSCAQ